MYTKKTAKQFLAKTAACVCTLALIAAFPMVPANAAIDENGDFHGWELYNETSGDLPAGTTVFNIEADAEKGEVIHAFRPKTDERVNIGVISQDFTGLTKGRAYKVSFDIKTDSLNNGYVQALIWNAKANADSTENYIYGDLINTGNKWERRSVTFIADAESCNFKLLICSAYGAITDDYNVWATNFELNDADYRAPIGPSLTGWTNSISSVYTGDSSDGDGACAFIPLNTSGNGLGSMEYRFAPFITKPGEYTISYDIKTVEGYTENQILIQGTVDYLWDNATQKDIGPDNWSHFSGSFSVPEGKNVQRIVIYPKADCYIDNISVKDAEGNEYVYNGDFYNSANPDGFEALAPDSSDYCSFVDGPDGGYLFISPKGSTQAEIGKVVENKYTLPTAVEPGKSYTLSFEAAAAGIPSRVSVHVNNISNGTGWYDIDVSAADGWVKQEIEIVPNETTQWFTFYTPDWKAAGETFYIRNISVKDADGKEYMGDTDFLAGGTPGNLIPEADVSPADVINCGDLTGDGRVDLLDLIRIKKVLADENTEHMAQNKNINKDNSFDAGDMALLRKYLMGAVATLN